MVGGSGALLMGVMSPPLETQHILGHILYAHMLRWSSKRRRMESLHACKCRITGRVRHGGKLIHTNVCLSRTRKHTAKWGYLPTREVLFNASKVLSAQPGVNWELRERHSVNKVFCKGLLQESLPLPPSHKSALRTPKSQGGPQGGRNHETVIEVLLGFLHRWDLMAPQIGLRMFLCTLNRCWHRPISLASVILAALPSIPARKRASGPILPMCI